jgi:glycerophosphoryl diester phosphodiesterase
MQQKIKSLIVIAALNATACTSTSNDGNQNYKVKNKPALTVDGKPVSTSKPELPIPEWADKEPSNYELQAALVNRGLFLDVSGQIRFLQKNPCGGYKVQAHRGHHQFFENSRLSFTHALADGFDGVELDLVKNGDFYFLHHDSKFGRAASDVAGSDASPTGIRMKKEFHNYYHRDMRTGELSSVNLPLLPEIVERYHEIAKPYQVINFDLKAGMRRSHFQQLEYMLSSQNVNVEFSSTDPDDLSAIREINTEIYLGVITPANSDSIKQLKAEATALSAHDPLFKHNDYLNQRLERAVQPTIKNYLRWAGRLGQDTNFGYHIDIRDLDNNPSLFHKLKSQTKAKRIVTYSINSQKYHLQVLQKLKRQNIQPDVVIIDDDMFGFCAQIQPLKVTQTYSSNHPLQQMPFDADARVWLEQEKLAKDGLYLALDGKVKPIKAAVLQQVTPSIINKSDNKSEIPKVNSTNRQKSKEFIPVKDSETINVDEQDTVIIDIQGGGI